MSSSLLIAPREGIFAAWTAGESSSHHLVVVVVVPLFKMIASDFSFPSLSLFVSNHRTSFDLSSEDQQLMWMDGNGGYDDYHHQSYHHHNEYNDSRRVAQETATTPEYYYNNNPCPPSSSSYRMKEEAAMTTTTTGGNSVVVPQYYHAPAPRVVIPSKVYAGQCMVGPAAATPDYSTTTCYDEEEEEEDNQDHTSHIYSVSLVKSLSNRRSTVGHYPSVVPQY